MPVDRSLLPHQSPFDLLDRESARIDAFLTPLVEAGDDDPRWRGRTRCAAWDVRALFGHLRHLEDYNRACLDGTVAGLLASAPDGFDAFNDAGAASYATAPVGRLLDEWRQLNDSYRARMRERGDGVVDTSVGAYPSLFQAFYLAVEYATHGDDLGITSAYDGRDSWRAAFARFALTEQDRPVTVRVRQSGWTEVTRQDVTYLVSDHDLAEVAAARLGDNSGLPEEVRAALRCFA